MRQFILLVFLGGKKHGWDFLMAIKATYEELEQRVKGFEEEAEQY